MSLKYTYLISFHIKPFLPCLAQVPVLTELAGSIVNQAQQRFSLIFIWAFILESDFIINTVGLL